MTLKLLIALVALLALPMAASAQSYSIDWFTVDGGGGTSTGGVFTLSGTIGQPDAGAMSGGSYTLNGGFWSITAIQTPGAPFLSITNAGTNVVVFWPLPATGFVLDRVASLDSLPPAWTQVPFPYQTNGPNISVTVAKTNAARFYRLRRP